jgi:hypothetical protein
LGNPEIVALMVLIGQPTNNRHPTLRIKNRTSAKLELFHLIIFARAIFTALDDSDFDRETTHPFESWRTHSKFFRGDSSDRN